MEGLSLGQGGPSGVEGSEKWEGQPLLAVGVLVVGLTCWGEEDGDMAAGVMYCTGWMACGLGLLMAVSAVEERR